MARSNGQTQAPPASTKRRVFGLVLVLACVAIVVLGYPMMRHLELADLERIIAASGAWAALASIGLMVVHSFIPFPAELLAIANGMMFGPLLGTIVTWTGAMLGASLAFALARWLGRPFVQKFVSHGKMAKADEWLETSGWQVMILARLLPLIAFNLINYAAGLSRIGWWTFLWTTSVGILPLTIMMVVMGDNVEIIADYWQLLAVGGLALGLILAARWFRRRRRDPKPPLS